MTKKTERPSVKVKGAIYSAKCDRNGEWLLTLEIPSCDGIKAAALATMTETTFDIDFKPQEI